MSVLMGVGVEGLSPNPLPFQFKAFIAVGGDFGGALAVHVHAAGVGHEDARFAGHVGAEVPGVAGLRHQGRVGGFVDVLDPCIDGFGRWLDLFDALALQVIDTVRDPLDVLLDAHRHVA